MAMVSVVMEGESLEKSEIVDERKKNQIMFERKI